MKKEIHPEFHTDAKVTCSCGATFVVGSTLPEIKVEICSNCHPFYTGTEKILDTAGRVEKFKAKTAKAKSLEEEEKKKKEKKQAKYKKQQEKKVASTKKTPAKKATKKTTTNKDDKK